MLFRALAAFWVGLAQTLGVAVRRIGHTARELDPEHRRDGAGLTLVALGIVVAAAVWWRLPGDVMGAARTVVTGSAGILGWFAPLLLALAAWRTLRNPESNGPAGRQVVGWAALVFGLAGLLHLSHDAPAGSDSEALQQAGGAVGLVIGSPIMPGGISG